MCNKEERRDGKKCCVWKISRIKQYIYTQETHNKNLKIDMGFYEFNSIQSKILTYTPQTFIRLPHICYIIKKAYATPENEHRKMIRSSVNLIDNVTSNNS